MKIHIVKKGDSLYELSKKYGVPLVKIVDANPQLVDPNKLDIGMKIKIPIEPVPVPGPEGSQPIIHKHPVKQGDSLWKLSKAWGVSLKEIIDANPQLKNPNALLVGEIVNIPSAGTFTNTGNAQHKGETENKPNKTVPGSKTYTGPKEEMTAPMPNLPEMPKPPVLPEVEVKPNENIEPEQKIYHEINIKPEITIMKELVVMPEMPQLPPAEPMYEEKHEEKQECPEKNFIPEPCPSYPDYSEHLSPQQLDGYYPNMMFQKAPAYVNPEPPCGCHGQGMVQPKHEWHVPQQNMGCAGQHESEAGWGAQTSYYPGIMEQPNGIEYSQINVTDPYTTGMPSYMSQVEQQHSFVSYESGMGMENMYHKSPCGCQGGYEMPVYEQGVGMGPNWSLMYPLHHMGHIHYPNMPCYGGYPQPYAWPVQGMEGMAQTMGNSAYPQGGVSSTYPWHGDTAENQQKDCGCHGRQNEEAGSVSNQELNANFQEETDEGLKAEAKVSREEVTRVRQKSTTKKGRKQISKPKRKNPWIRG